MEDDVYLVAARAYDEGEYDYPPASTYVDGEAGRRAHIDRDLRSTADDPRFRAAIEAALAYMRLRRDL